MKVHETQLNAATLLGKKSTMNWILMNLQCDWVELRTNIVTKLIISMIGQNINSHILQLADGRYICVFQGASNHYLAADWALAVGSASQGEGNSL